MYILIKKKTLVGLASGVNFINIKRAHFSYEHHFSSYMYIVKAVEMYVRTKNSYV